MGRWTRGRIRWRRRCGGRGWGGRAGAGGGGGWGGREGAAPGARGARQLTEGGAAVVVARGGVAAGVGAGRRVIAMETVAAEPADDPQLAVPLDALAYVAFTSGSTGR